MTLNNEKSQEIYQGFEQGPIRPPSEAYSLLIRATRNCPWNHCTFCPVYKGERFSLRPVLNVKRDIDTLKKFILPLREIMEAGKSISREDINRIASKADPSEMSALQASVNWISGGMQSIFIQDANSLVMKPENLIDILTYIRDAFPWVKRITSYARSHTIARIKDSDMKAIADSGLNRIHIGLESGSDKVLEMVRKGVTKDMHIRAGKKVKHAGIELSEYVMPGLGGRSYSEEHARETADALNQINADFIRLRTLAIPNHVDLFKDYESGRFDKCTDLLMCKEILLFIETLNGISSTLKSDHILNLFQDVEGKFPQDKPHMVNILKTFLGMSPEDQVLFQVGRRIGMFFSLDDMNHINEREKVKGICANMGITSENVDDMIDEMMRRFI
ncbi:MAG: radical SAM protein [Proteobacteria bacterium]|nr:radical SAM protein [Pseudomonadota bacterium]